MQDDKPSTQVTGCACVAVDAYDCWDRRYHLHRRIDDTYDPNELSQRERVDADGGPCECSCHADDEDEERDW